MQETSKKKYLFKNVALIALGSFGSKLISFFLVPLYTHALSVVEYGKLDIITILSTILMPFISFNIHESVMRFCIDKDKSKDDILKVGTSIAFFSGIITVLCYPVLLRVEPLKDYALLFCLYTFSTILSSVFMCFIRGCEQLFSFSIISIIHSLSIAFLNIVFLLFLHLGIRSFFLAYITSNIISALLCLIIGHIPSRIRQGTTNKSLRSEMLKYSIILIPNSIMWWIINSSDRVMVSTMAGISENGLYAISYKIPSLIITFTTIFNQAWMFSAIKESKSKDKESYTKNIYSALFASIVTLATLILFCLKPLMSLYVSKDFFRAWTFVPPLLLGTIFLTLGTFISNEYTAQKDSWGFLKSSIIGATVNIVLNLLLIPHLGALGAAAATAISYIAVFTFRCFDTKKYIRIKWLNIRQIINLLILAIATLVVYINNPISYLLLFVLLLAGILLNISTWKAIFIEANKTLKVIRGKLSK